MWVPLLAALTLVPTQTWIRQGPVLAGSQVVWTSDVASVYASAPVRRLWRAERVSVPRGLPEDPRISYRVDQEINALTASASTAAFVRTVELYRIPICADAPCPGVQPREQRLRGDVWSGPPRGPFRRIARGALDADVDRNTVVYSETSGGKSGIVVARPHAARIQLTSEPDVEFPHVAVAGRYEHWPAPPATVVVYDLRTRRPAYTLGPQELGHVVVSSLDLEVDGTVAVASDPSPAGGCDGGVAWASIAEPKLHYLSGNAIPWRIRIAAGRIAFITRTCVAPTPFRLVLRTLDGRTLADGVVAYGGFDFDGHRLAYLRSPKTIRVDRLR